MTNLHATVALGLGACLMAMVPSATAHAAATCLGQPATIEASAGGVMGTPGNDVIVVTGTVSFVLAGDGNDLICLAGTEPSYVDSGPGADRVDASAAGAKTSILLGPGSDSLVGSAYPDHVEVGTRGASLSQPGDPGPYSLTTGGGRDTLTVDVGAVVDADLGGGADGMLYTAVEGTPPSHVDLGPGRDSASFFDDYEDEGAGETTLRVDLVREVMEWHGVTSVLLGAESIRGVARRVRVRGDEGPNRLFSFGCDVRFRGGPGDDLLTMRNTEERDTQPFDCRRGEVRKAYGNGGDDTLRGGLRLSHDVLIGGPGRDEAYGGPAGHDVCIAEIVIGKGCAH